MSRVTVTESSDPKLVGTSWTTDSEGTHAPDIKASIYGAIESAFQAYCDLDDMTDALFLELATESVEEAIAVGADLPPWLVERIKAAVDEGKYDYPWSQE